MFKLATGFKQSKLAIGTGFLSRLPLVVLACLGSLIATAQVAAQTSLPEISIMAGSSTTTDPLYQDSANATFTIKLSSAFSSQTLVILRVHRFNSPGQPTNVNTTSDLATISVADSQDLTHPYTTSYNQLGSDYQSITVSITAGPGYAVASTNAAATVHRPTGTSPLATITTSSESIEEGGSVNLGVNLTHSPGHNVFHKITVSWPTAGLVTSIQGFNAMGQRVTAETSTVTSHTISTRVLSAGTSNSNADSVVVSTGAVVMDGATATITASLVEEDPHDPDPKESPIYDPIYHSTKAMTSITVTAEIPVTPAIDITWTSPSDFNNTILVHGRTGTLHQIYSNVLGSLSITKPAAATVRYFFNSQKGEGSISRFPEDETMYWETPGAVPYRFWQVTLHDNTVGLRPGGITDNTGILGLAPGEYYTEKLTFQIRKDTATLLEKTFTVTLRRPKLTLNFANATQSESITSNNSSSYADLSGTISVKNSQDTGTRPVFTTSEDGDFFSEKTGSLDPGDGTPSTQSITSNGKTLYPVGGNFSYGTWYFSLDGSEYLFRPVASTINKLAEHATVTSRATVMLKDTTTSQSLTVTITKPGPKSVSLQWDSGSSGTITADGSASYSDLAGSIVYGGIGDVDISSDAIKVEVVRAGVGHSIQGSTGLAKMNEILDSAVHFIARDSPNSQQEYGTWAVTRTAFVFRPNANGINNNLNSGETVTIELEFKVTSSNVEYVDMITLTISKPSPVLSIATVQDAVDEGVAIMFTVTSDISPLNGFTVVFDTSESTGNYFNSISPVTFTSGGMRTQTGTVTTINQSGPQDNGTIVVRITDTDDYDVDTDNPSISVDVQDTDRIGVSVTKPSGTVTEGELAEFIITADSVPATDLTVNVEVEQTGNILSLWAPSQIVIPAGTTSILYGLATNRFNYSDVPGTISVKILPGENYRPKDGFDSPATKAMVIVGDNGLTAATASGVSVASMVLEQILAQSSATSPAAPPSVVDANHIAIDETDQLDGTVPTVSVAAVQLSVNEGDAVQFRLQSTRAVARSLSIAVRVSSSNATVADELPVQVGLHAGETETHVVIQTTNDDLAGDDGAVVLTVRSGAGYIVDPDNASTTVNISDASDRAGRGWELQTAGLAVHSEILESLASHSLFTAANRFERAFESTRQNSFKLGGINSMAELITLGGESLNGNSAPWQSVLHGTAFEVDGSPTAGGAGPTTFWGRGDYRTVAGLNGGSATDWTGGIFSGQLGLDTTVDGGVLLGLAASEVVSEFEYDISESRPLRLESRSSGVYPYIGIKPATKEFQLLVTAGYGMSETLVRQERYEPETQSGIFHMVGLNGRGQLYADSRGRESGTTALKVTGKTWYAGQNMAGTAIPELEVAGGHARIGLAAVHERAAVDGTGYGSSLAMELRMDERNDRSFAGVEFENQTNVELPVGLKVMGTGLALMSGVNRVDSWAVSMTANYDSNHDDLGMMVAFQPAMGWTDARLEGILWSDNLLGGIDSVPRPNGPGIDTEVAYGLDTHDGKGQVTPFVGFELGRSNQTTYQIGSRYSVDANLAIELVGKQQFTDSNSTNRRLDLKETLSW